MSNEEFSQIIETIFKKDKKLLSTFEKNLLGVAYYLAPLAKKLIELGGNKDFEVYASSSTPSSTTTPLPPLYPPTRYKYNSR